MDKYTVDSYPLGIPQPSSFCATVLYQATNKKGEQLHVATFYGPNAHTNATKVCNLLNETSRSQGKYPTNIHRYGPKND